MLRRFVRLHELEVRRWPRYRAELTLGYWLLSYSQADLRRRLRCDEFTALRLRVATTPSVNRWGEQVTLLAAKLRLDRADLASLLREVGAAARWDEVRVP